MFPFAIDLVTDGPQGHGYQNGDAGAAFEISETAFQQFEPADRFAVGQHQQMSVHVPGGLVAPVQFGPASLENHLVQFQEPLVVGSLPHPRRQFRKILAIFAGADFVKHFAQAINIGLRRAWAFRRDEAFSADVRPGLLHLGHQPNVRQLGHSVDKDDVGRLDVAVNEPAFVEFGQRMAQRQAQLQTFLHRELSAGGNLLGQRLGRIAFGLDALTRKLVVAQLHHVVEIALLLVDPNVQHVNKAFVRTGDGLKPANAG